MKAVVLGSGGWGTALALVLIDNGHDVTLWSAFPEEAKNLMETGKNPYLKNIKLPESLKITDDISCSLGAELIVFAPPSFAMRETARKLKGNVSPGAIIVTASKGIEYNTSMRMSEIIAEEIGAEYSIVALSGPTHAEEVSRKMPTGAVSASVDEKAAEFVQDAFMNLYFRIYTSADIVGVELGGALKNMVAICSGMCDGLGCGDNTRAMLTTRGLAEMSRLGESLGGKRETFAGLAGVGDLIVTCTSQHSRNRRAGFMIGQGMPVKEVLEGMGGVVEGYYVLASVKQISERMNIEMPLCNECYKIMYEGKAPDAAIHTLMTRSKKAENI